MMPRVWLLALLLLPLLACGADGVEAPYVIGPEEETSGCPTTEEALASTKQALRAGKLAALGPIAREILIEDGGLRVLVPALLELAEEVPPRELLGVFQGYDEGEGLARMKPHLVNVLEYVAGTSPYIEGEHYAPVDALHRVMTGCDLAESVGALRRLFELEVEVGGEVQPWIDVTFDALLALTRDPLFGDLLERMEFSDEEVGGEGEIVVGREAFKLLARLVSGSVASPDFDLDYLRSVLNDLLVSQLDAGTQTRENLNRLLDLLAIAVDPEAEIFPHMQALMACVNREDKAGEIPGMLFDYLSIEALDFTVFLDDLDAMGSDPAGDALRIALSRSARALEDAPRIIGDAVQILARFLEPERSRTVVPAVLGLRGTGLARELVGFFRRFATGCREGDGA